MIKDLWYRYFNCNIQCPRVKTDILTTSKIDLPGGIEFGQVLMETGDAGFGNAFSISPETLSLTNSCGELTCYIRNDASGDVSVVMIAVAKSNGVIATPTVYQRVGTFGLVTSSVLSTTTVRVILPTGFQGRCYWVWRGI